MIDEQTAWQEMHTASQMAHVQTRVDQLLHALAELPDWQPGRALAASGVWLDDYLAQLAARWDQKLVVALVGPSGAGKSTLFNRLVGAEVSQTGLTRPTTRQVIASCAEEADITGLRALLGQDTLRYVPQGDAALADIILLDTPDTNTLPENRQLLTRLLEHVDLVVPVFSALNPKLEDNIAYLQTFIARMPREAILPVLNMVDRVPEEQLLLDVLPDWRQSLMQAWDLVPERPVFLTHARADEQVNEDEQPLHHIDQVDHLRRALIDGAGHQEQAQARRVAQAEHLVERFERHVAQELDQGEDPRAQALRSLEGLREQAVQALRKSGPRQLRRTPVELTAHLLGLVSQRLVGPLGWLMLIWALGVRLAEVLGQVWRRGLGSLWSRQEDSRYVPLWALTMAEQLGQVLHQAIAQSWTPIGDALVAAGFGGARRQIGQDASAERQAQAVLCQSAADQMLEDLAQSITRWPIQLMFNLPILGLAAWVAFDALGGFISRQFLPPGYFEHALVALLTTWALAFALYQLLLGIVLRKRFGRRLVREIIDELLEQHTRGYVQELARLEALRRDLG